MRILHTSDWHLGRSFHRVGLLDAQATYIDHLVEVVVSERIDVVLIAGDVYDRALPPVDVVALLDEALARIRAAGARVVMSSGNHDSAHRLGFGAALMAGSGVHVRTRLSGLATPIVINDAHGPVAFYPIPYLEPSLCAGQLEATADHEGVLGRALELIDADRKLRDPSLRTVVSAHAFVAGGEASDSERDLRVGGVSVVPRSLFDLATYAALGHLHGRQVLSDTVRYSGSPLAYSFSEHAHEKSSWLVELGPSAVASVHAIPAPVPRALRRLRGEVDELLLDPNVVDAERAWCQVTVTDSTRPSHAMERLRSRFPHTLELRFEPQGPRADQIGYAQRVSGHSDLEVCCGFLEHVRHRPPSAGEHDALAAVLESTRQPEAIA